MDGSLESQNALYPHHTGSLWPMKHKGFNTNKLLEKLDLEIRNAKIATTWAVISELTDKSYKEKVQYLMDEYHLGYSRIEDIINMDEE